MAEPVEGGPGSVGRTLVCPTGDDSALWNTSGEQLCVVCQSFPLSRALLPCRLVICFTDIHWSGVPSPYRFYVLIFSLFRRHTCICASCFMKLERCPMCRGPIKSYFCIRGEEYMPIQPGSKNVSSHSPLYSWLDSWNDRLTDFLGFQR